MKRRILFILPVMAMLLAGCVPVGDSSGVADSISDFSSDATSSSSDEERKDSFYRAPDQGIIYYDVSRAGEMDSVPAIGDVNLLVIPVIIDGYRSAATSKTRSDIQKVMFGETNDTSWESVASFYQKSSYGKLNLSGSVTNWFDSGYSSSDMISLENRNIDSVSILMEDAIEWVRNTQPQIDLKDYDNDSDGHIDAVWMIYSAPSDLNDVFWAYVYWNYRNQNNKNTANPTPFAYAWASFDFMYEGYGTSGIDGHTFIHETGHLLGLDDYYDYDGKTSPMGVIDMMDNNIIDHNGFSKFALGWTNPYIVTGDADIEIYPASLNGDAILLAADWNGNPFDEYILLELYTPDGLNERDSNSAYPGNNSRGFTIPGIRMYHVDARLYDTQENTYVDSLNSNAYIGASNSESWSFLDTNKGKFKLLSLVDANKNARYLSSPYAIANNNTLFTQGKVFAFQDYKSAFPLGNSLKMNDATTFPFSIEFSQVNSDIAKIKIRVI